jgi:hypothetical protein
MLNAASISNMSLIFSVLVTRGEGCYKIVVCPLVVIDLREFFSAEVCS